MNYLKERNFTGLSIPLFAGEFHNLVNCALKMAKLTHLYVETTLAPLSKSVRTVCAILNKIAGHPFGHFYETNKGKGYDQNGCGEDTVRAFNLENQIGIWFAYLILRHCVCVCVMLLARSPARSLALSYCGGKGRVTIPFSRHSAVVKWVLVRVSPA